MRACDAIKAGQISEAKKKLPYFCAKFFQKNILLLNKNISTICSRKETGCFDREKSFKPM